MNQNEKMNYIEPKLTVITWQADDVVRTSVIELPDDNLSQF